MSMPERIWRIVRGRWLMAEERYHDSMAEQEAARELADDSVPQAFAPGRIEGRRVPQPLASARRPITASPRQSIDPLAADLALLGAPPACDMATLDRVYADRLAELRPDAFPTGSPEHDGLVARRAALAEAYERLRDMINTTETRFEKLEF